MSIAERVDKIMMECLADAPTGRTIDVEGIVHNFRLSRSAIDANRDEIRALLNLMDERFRTDMGGGYSFLGLPFDKSGEQWGEHANAEALYVLGAAAGMARTLLPRSLWKSLPGGVPYIAIDLNR